MGLAVKKFFSMRPQLSFRFSVDIIEKEKDIGTDTTNLGICVKNVKVTTGEADTTKGATYYGNGYFTIPVYNIADKTLEISFNETDDLYVLKWLDRTQFTQANGIPEEIDIRITEYDETMTNEISKILYTCYLKEYSEPAFSRSGSVSFSTIDATFIIIDEIDELAKEKRKVISPTDHVVDTRTEVTGANHSSGVGRGESEFENPFVAVKGQPQIKDDSDQGAAWRDREAAEREKYASPTGHVVDTRTEVTGANRSSGLGLGAPEFENVQLTTNMEDDKQQGAKEEVTTPEENNEVSRRDIFIKAIDDTLAYVQLNELKYSKADTTDMRLSFDDPNKFMNKHEADKVGDRKGLDCSTFVSQGLYAAFGEEFAKYASRKESATTYDIQRFYKDHKDYFEVIEVKEGTELKKGDIALRAVGGTLKKGDEHRDNAHVLVIGEDKTITSMNDKIYTMESTNDCENGIEGKRRIQGEFRRSAGYLKGISGTKHGGYLILRIKDKARPINTQ